MLDKEIRQGDRIAKIIAHAGVCSRRDAEELILQGRVTYKGKKIETAAAKFTSIEGIAVDGKFLVKQESRLWIYHKPVGLVVSHKDEQGRSTVFDNLPLKDRVISVGRLDKNTSGLLLLTNDGEIARELELPQNKYQRVYLARIFTQQSISKELLRMKKILSKPFSIENIIYQPVKLELESSTTNNHWLKLTIKEGKNREIRKILQYFDLKISRLIRIQYGPFTLDDLAIGEVMEIHDWQESDSLVLHNPNS